MRWSAWYKSTWLNVYTLHESLESCLVDTFGDLLLIRVETTRFIDSRKREGNGKKKNEEVIKKETYLKKTRRLYKINLPQENEEVFFFLIFFNVIKIK